MKKDSNMTVDSVPGLRAHEMLYNMNRDNIGNKDFRKGIDSLVDRQEIIVASKDDIQRLREEMGSLIK